ncbi:hypothetical protein PV10_01989 [Exophiala mesophila]|uniref:Methyltransferase domain-containing protein n=1 Tax=Exophiala mesophila TaxID=212818 RepID=A0A0D1Y110_EXOME|nr:uncharacterized protein PV10_01989 [Exophiala mesophila]KIV94201.1 hypothetical protein PV10_01989 [Exophiala mesophila]
MASEGQAQNTSTEVTATTDTSGTSAPAPQSGSPSRVEEPPPVDAIDSSDADSGYNDSSLSSTASLRSSIYEFDQENGRTYQRGSEYVMPNDEEEQRRMDIHYHSLRFAIRDRLYYAPIENPTSVIDVGTGTGIWAMDMADNYPAAQVLGIDLSPIQPTWVAPNLEFQIFDLEQTWDMPQRFDLVHSREMNGFSIKSWPKYFEQAFLSLKPGGWVECQEFDLDIKSDDNTIPEDSNLIKWQNLWEEGIQKAGLTGRCYPEKMVEQLKEAGFINTRILPFKMPTGPWAKDPMLRQSGLCVLAGMLDGMTGLSMRVFTQLLGWSVEEMEILLAKAKVELKNKRIHSYFPIYIVYGQKPPL